MGIVQSLTAARMLAIEAASVVSGVVTGDDLILTRYDGTSFNAGNVRGAKGDKGDKGDDGVDGAPATRSRILNNRFRVNQRGFESGNVSQGINGRIIGCDRWETGGSQTSPSETVYTVEVAPPGTLPENDEYFIRLKTTGASQPQSDFVFLSQRMENARTLSGRLVTISFWARVLTGPTRYVAPQLYQNFGTGGSPSTAVDIPVNKVSVTTSWTRYSVQVTVPSTVGKTFGTNMNSYLALRFWVSAGTNYNGVIDPVGFQYDSFDFYGVQIEEGAVTTPLVWRSESQDLLECQRFFWALGEELYYTPFSGWGGCVVLNTQTVETFIPFPTTMRKMPSVQMSGMGLQLPNGDISVNAFTSISDRSASSGTFRPRSGGVYRFSGLSTPTLPSLGQAVRVVPMSTTAAMLFSAEY